jgi:hypothetical protein
VGFAPAAWVVAGLLFIGSPLLFYGSIIWESMLQAEVPRELLGRVSSVDWLISLGISPIGVAIAGVVAGTIGVRVTIIVPALAVSIFALMVLLFVPQLSAIDKRAQVLGADEAASA